MPKVKIKICQKSKSRYAKSQNQDMPKVKIKICQKSKSRYAKSQNQDMPKVKIKICQKSKSLSKNLTYMDPLKEELLYACKECLELHDGIAFTDWCSVMLEQYPCEVADALGRDDQRITQSLTQIWQKLHHCSTK